MSAKAKALGRGVQSRPRASFTQEPFGGSLDESPELVVHTGTEDVVIELDVDRCDVSNREGRSGERGPVVELDIEIFALDRPAVAERVFKARTHCPTAAGSALLMAVPRAPAGKKF